MNAILSEKGQITIPKALRDSLGLTTGSVLEFQEESGRLVVRKVRNLDPLTKWKGRGSLPEGVTVDVWLGQARDGA